MKKLFSFILAVTICLGMVISSSATGENQYVEHPVNMPDVPATVPIPLEHQKVIAEGMGIDLFKEVPEDFVAPRTSLAVMTPKNDKRLVKLVIKFEKTSDKLNYGTGFMIGPDAVATAAHNMNHPRYGKATSITCHIGVGSGMNAIHSETITDTSRFYRPTSWDDTQAYRYDYGVIKLKQAVTSVGSFGFGVYSDNVLSSNTFTLMGYGGDAYPSAASSTLSNIGTDDFYYSIHTRGGDSGGPVFYNNGYVAGIHAYGTAPPQYPLPSATRITSEVFNNLKAWRYK
ncbi:MAG: trypsin-like serine protease [Negativibacillus sp.]|nr:trypsin-like serine protease [Negativibacillus sp.]